MPRRTGGSGINATFVVTEAHALDLTATPGDKITGMLCPGDGATVIDMAITIRTAGTGSFNHELILEHGLAGAGTAVSPQIDVLADAADGTIVTGNGLDRAGQGVTTKGTIMQFLNAESGSITVGAIVDVSVLWRL